MLQLNMLHEMSDESLGLKLFALRKYFAPDDEACVARAAISKELGIRGHDAFAFADRVGAAYLCELNQRTNAGLRKAALAAWNELDDDTDRGDALIYWFQQTHPQEAKDIRALARTGG
jgi:hypothetical protein